MDHQCNFVKGDKPYMGYTTHFIPCEKVFKFQYPVTLRHITNRADGARVGLLNIDVADSIALKSTLMQLVSVFNRDVNESADFSKDPTLHNHDVIFMNMATKAAIFDNTSKRIYAPLDKSQQALVAISILGVKMKGTEASFMLRMKQVKLTETDQEEYCVFD
jgi:hypothetical protein